MEKSPLEKKYKTFMLWGVVMTIVGLILVCAGILMKIFGDPQFGITSTKWQPVIIDGTYEIIFGLTSLLIGSYRLIFKRKAFKNIRDLETQKQVDELENRMKSNGYGQKEMKKQMKVLREKMGTP